MNKQTREYLHDKVKEIGVVDIIERRIIELRFKDVLKELKEETKERSEWIKYETINYNGGWGSFTNRSELSVFNYKKEFWIFINNCSYYCENNSLLFYTSCDFNEF